MLALIKARQYKFFKRFPSTLAQNSSRYHVFEALLSKPSKYLKHYVQLSQQYENHNAIYTFHSNEVKDKIRNNAGKGMYRFEIYLKYNPELEQSPFVNCLHPMAKHIIRFRLGSHRLPIETGRWKRIKRESRFCEFCNVVGDEHHFLYICPLIQRDELGLSNDMGQIWSQEGIIELFKQFRNADLL